MNIVLIGYRGTGKSAVGALLSARLQLPCVSMDAAIVTHAGMSIPDIVAQESWAAFRDRESAVARELGAQDQLIIDTGGGVIERPENIDVLRANGRIIWLKASVDTIVKRIHDDTQRPSLTGGKTFIEEVEEVLARRNPIYHTAAQFEIDTDALTPTEVVELAIKLLENDNN